MHGKARIMTLSFTPSRRLTGWLIWITAFSIATRVAMATPASQPFSLSDLHFTQDGYNATIPENSLGKTFVIPTSKMGIYIPEGQNVRITYQIENSDELFKAEDYVLGDFVFLLVRSYSSSYGRLNRELQSMYRLKVKASAVDKDGGATYETTTDLIVFITDLNDLQPLFDYRVYNVSVKEDTPLHTSIARVTAFDGDEGINAEIYYSLTEKTNIFSVHPTSGIVSLTRHLNYHKKKTHILEIMAKDRGPQSLQHASIRPATLRLSVLEVNYFKPEISITKMPNVVEPDNDEITLALVTVKDKDIGENGQVHSLEIVSGHLNNLISLQKGEQDGEYRVKLMPKSNTRLPSNGFNVTLKATDKGDPPLSSIETFHINTIDTNLIPKFTQPFYYVSVEEIAPINTPVMFVSLAQARSNLDVRFEILSGNRKNLFKLNQISGLLSTSSSLDAEKVSNVQLQIIVYDAIQKKKSSAESCIVSINITDSNDNTPKFTITDNVSEIYISENLPIGSSVFQISAKDKDHGENGKISFSITNVRNIPFEIEPFSGVIRNTKILDYETMRHSHKLNIRVSDWGTPFAREREMVFRINIQDVNDNQPHFEKLNCMGYLSRDAPIDTEILIVPAIDFDINDIIQYQIESGNDDHCFHLHRDSARIVLNCSLLDLPEDTRVLRIVATDGIHTSEPVDVRMTLVNAKQNNQLANSLVNIKCDATDIFEQLQTLVTQSRQNNLPTDFGIPEKKVKEAVNHPPVFNDSIPAELQVSESLPVGTVLARLEATDADVGFNGVLVYVIRTGDIDGHFKVDMHTGGLMIMSSLDREIRDEYNLYIEVYDLGSPSLSANTTIRIKVLDENDNAPKFEHEVYKAVISENVFLNATVTQVTATDIDQGDNSVITYTIVSDNDHFSVNPVNGIVTVNRPLDRERHPVYKVLVRASDKGEKHISMSSTATVLVELTDVNDVVPEFTPEVYSVRIREDLPVGAVVTVVTAADTDEGKNGEVTYKLVYGENYFQIDSETGVIRIKAGLDYEVQQIHNISVRAQDGGVPPLMSACFINVEVIDVNENLMPPVFENFWAHGYVNENEPIGTTVMFVKATDPEGDGISYSIRDGSGLGRFIIDSNGTITTSQVLDRETATHYWLTVYAQDHGLVPLHTRLEVYIEVKDTNDHIPMTFDPVYYGRVPENTVEKGLFITQVQAFDLDKNPAQRLTYRITRFDPDGLFNIDEDTGVISTNGIPLDREKEAIHQLEVTVSDNGDPPLDYKTRVYITIQDENDNRPQISDRLYRIRFPETRFMGLDIPVFQVLAWDEDTGPNGDLTFDIKFTKDEAKIFRIQRKTGMVYANSDLVNGALHHFVVRVSDNGRPRSRKTTAKVRIEVIDQPRHSSNRPRFDVGYMEKRVMEDDKVGHMVELLGAYDADNDNLFYSIIEGDPDNHFYIGLDGGNLLVARQLDWETQAMYNLTVQVTDGVNFDNCTVVIRVIDINDNYPLFKATGYHGEFPESAPVGTSLLKVQATDRDDDKLIYSLPKCCNSAASLEMFTMNAETGDVVVRSPLDREVAMQHNLTVMVSDQGVSTNRNYTRVTIDILDKNDHRPTFLAEEFYGRVFETAAIGTSVLQVLAVDQDKGDNAEITYSILSGNYGGVFAMDSMFGTISVAKELDRNTKAQYELAIMATDKGDRPMSGTSTAVIEITISDNAPPRFDHTEYMAELHENQPRYTNVYTVLANCRSSVIYTIIDGNTEGIFAVNPNSGVVYTKKTVDYESDRFFNLTIKATSVIHSSAMTNLLIHIVDENDNAPEFLKDIYIGNVTESSKPGTVVLNDKNEPLVVLAIDKDSDLNALLTYEIREEFAKDYITIDSNTGAVRTVVEFDHEKMDKIEFSVEVWDMGKPRLRTKYPARVIVYINDVNDTPPKFSSNFYSFEVLLPTYKDVIVAQLNASDDDTGVNSKLTYSIVGGNTDDRFSVNPDTGSVFVSNETGLGDVYTLTVEVSDGIHRAEATVDIHVSRTINSAIQFTRDVYEAAVQENSEVIRTLTVVQVADRPLNQLYFFTLLNGQDKFEIGYTSGVLTTLGVSLDREEIDMYNLVVQVQCEMARGREKAHALVQVSVEDENDNSPVFVHQPYHAVVVYDFHPGQLIKQVTAIDRDSGYYGHVTYTFKGKDRGDAQDNFVIDSKTGQISAMRQLSESHIGQEIILTVIAADGDFPPRASQAEVKVTIISSSYPVFDQQIYKAAVPEYSPIGLSVISVSANSPTSQKLIYTIIDGDRYGDFGVDFNIGVITVQGDIDYIQTQAYNLTVQATESFSGLTATAMVLVEIMDLNNIRPGFVQDVYKAIVSESAPIGASVVTVKATDEETGKNGLVHYTLTPAETGSKDVDWFSIDSQTGLITTRRFLDREKQSEYIVLVEASDSGDIPETGTATVTVHIEDLNNNAPVFDQPSYHCIITDQVQRGQLVTKVSATDPDVSSAHALRYSIISGNDQQCFQMDEDRGVISLSKQRKPDLHTAYELNISVSDGAFTNFARVTIRVQSSNNHAPRFRQSIYIVEFPENYGEGRLVTEVKADDDDVGVFGSLTYSIPSKEMQKYFRIDADTGELFSVQVLDREQSFVYNVPVAATDNGGHMGFSMVHVSVTDQNDNVPQFLAKEYKRTLLTSMMINSTVLMIQAEDHDSGVNGQVTFSFAAGTSSRVAQMFSLNPDTGVLTLVASIADSVSEIFQFFVQASDHGEPPMKNNVPVELWVTDNGDAQPHFSQPSYSFFMQESDPIGTVIATVKAESSRPLEYIIVPGFSRSGNSPAKFGIDSQGRIHVAGELDFETTPSFTLTVQAQTLNSLPLVQQATVNIRLMDVNDNYPYFESSPYKVTVPENSEVGIEIIRVTAQDADKSSKLTYSFGDEMLRYSHLFGLDSKSGLITLLSPLDREEKDLYNITVWVKDSDSGDALRNFTIVQVKVMDHNDNPPVFEKDYYLAAVNEDAYEGTVLMTLTTIDKDIATYTDKRFYIIDGDPLGKFKIRRNGDLFVNRPLDREVVPRYDLIVAVTDGGFVSTATVVVDIIDANDNAPVCPQLDYFPTVAEDVSFTWVIERVKATDADEYGSLRYQLSGENAGDFRLDPSTGVLTAVKTLDRERTHFYHLVATAMDPGQKSCTMNLYINVKDVNDNRPQFVPLSGPIMLSEDSPVNTLVYRASATDKDIGINRQISYTLKTDADGLFKMNEKSGLLQLAALLDRETTAKHRLTIVATDKGTPQLSSEMDIEVVVLDINDNPPEFEQTTYYMSVLESTAAGTSIGQIRATSRDTGLNAKISYFIQAGIDKDKFRVDQETGIVRVAGALDHEEVAGYMLTARAQDHGETPLSNTAYIQVNVTDVNDNPPIFHQKTYSGKVREDAQIGTRVIQVVSSDRDTSPENKAVNYSILSGDHMNVFDIHPTDGSIIVRSKLDREAVDSYVLHVRATNFHLYNDTMVKIEIEDANDSPPMFTEDNYTVFVQEDKEITSCILKFEVTDADLDPNGGPFSYDIIGGDGQRQFIVNPEGNLCITGNLNRQITATYTLVVRVFDNGKQPLFSDVTVTVNVIEESTYSPEVSNIDVSISSYLDEFPGGVIAAVKAEDADKYDTLTYEVVSPNRHLFDIDKKDGRVIAFAGLDAGLYLINVSVSDGKYTAFGAVNIEVSTVTEDMIANSITIQFENMESETFIKSYRKDFQKVLKRELNVRARDVEILSVQNSKETMDIANRKKRDADNNVDILFAVKKGQEFIPQQKLKRKVQRAVPSFEEDMEVKVLKVFSDVCEPGLCEGGECAGYLEFDKDSLVPVFMDGGSFVSAKHRYTYECVCPNGDVGDNCLPNPTGCAENTCPLYKICSPHPTHGYQCTCPVGKTGRHCEKDVDNKCDNTNCHRGDTPITFSGTSYARWTLLEPISSRLSLSLRIKSRVDSACIMYAKGRVDYSILELVNGMVQYRFDCGSGEGLVMIPYHISDGKWHTVMVERHANTAEIFLDGQYSAVTTAPGVNDVLNLDTSKVFFGAEVETYANGYMDVRKGFKGCIEDIRIYNVRLPVSGSNAVALSQDFERVEFSCRDSDFAIEGNNVCSSFPCMNGGHCETTSLSSYICKCSERYRGAKCEIDTDPCQRQPCLNNGQCENVEGVPNEYICKCPGGQKGRRCEYGKFCLPNPCDHGGTCIEGPTSFMCICRAGFNGKRCESIVNACEENPCLNGGQCTPDGSTFICDCATGFGGPTCAGAVNVCEPNPCHSRECIPEGNSYRCNCSSGAHSGPNCEDMILPEVSSSAAGINNEEIYAIAGIIGGIILVVLVFVLIRLWRRKKYHRRRTNVTAGIANDGQDVYLNLLKSDKHTYKAENTLKVDNMNNKKTPPSPQPPPVPDRPASYTPSAHESLNTLNNFDNLRNHNYGSAADELENIPNIPPYNLDFLQTFAPVRSVASVQPTVPVPPSNSDTESLQKENWEFACQNILQNYIADKHSDKLSKLMPIGTVVPMSHLQGQDTTSFSSLPVSETDDDQPGYHWDTSDWAPEKSLPNISEIPSGECPDSPGSASPHSNESNTHINNIEPSGHYNTDGEYIESEYVGDSEFADDTEEPPELPNYEEILAEQSKLLEDYESPNKNFHVHPNYYLPLNSSFTSENNGEIPPEGGWLEPPAHFKDNPNINSSDSSPTSSEDDNDSVLHYGFPPAHGNINRLSMITTDSDMNVEGNRLSAAFTTDSDYNGEYNRGSVVDDMSDISGLCEIEDSEVNLSDNGEGEEEEEEDLSETTPLSTHRIHTEV